MAVRMPSGWPTEVRPPGTEDWEATAVAFPVKLICSETVLVSHVTAA